jgi:hypothetical protein
MSDEIQVQVARVVDREAILEVLEANGMAAQPIEEEGVLGFRIPCEDGESERACDDLVATVESLIADAGLPLVPQRGDGFVFLRPPAD